MNGSLLPGGVRPGCATMGGPLLPGRLLTGVLLARLLLAGLLSVMAACGVPGPPGSPVPSERPAASPGPSGIVPPASPSLAVPSRTATASGASTAGPLAPPAAVLLVDSAAAPGALGSWTLDGQGSDSPWLPAAALAEVAIGPSPLFVRFADGVRIGAWTARAATASDVAGDMAGALGGREEAVPALASLEFGPPPPGRWVISVRLDRSDGRGDATFYWLVVVR